MSSPLLDIADALSAFADSSAALTEPAENCTVPFADRRAHVRLRPIDLPRPMLVRFRHGPLVRLLDVSTGGALLETATRLIPGGHIVLEFLAPGRRRTTTIPSRVVRSHVTALNGSPRYRSGVVFKQPLALAELDVARDEPSTGEIDASALATAIASIRSVASASRDRSVTRFLDEVVRQVQVCTSPRALMAFVEGRLRRQVPLVTVSFAPRAGAPRPAGDCHAFDLGQAGANDARRMHVEFTPACALDESQVRLLHAGASVMSLVHGWSRPPFGGSAS